jgi:formylglycine-generating enzyme required for sulfatase activity
MKAWNMLRPITQKFISAGFIALTTGVLIASLFLLGFPAKSISLAVGTKNALEDPPFSDLQVYLPVILKPSMVYLPFISSGVKLSVLQPTHNAEDVSPNAYLAWHLEEPPTVNPYYFDVYLDAGDVPTTRIATGLRNPWLDPETFEGGVTYSWQVIVVDLVTNARYPGAIWRFTTEAFDVEPDLDAMVFIPGGPFWMGCDSQNPYEFPCSYNIFHHDEPVRHVQIDPFEIDKYEVTNREYLQCMEAGACQAPRRTEQLYNPTYALSPVLYVSWWDAQNFCAWEGKRLPTEAEWEKAARGAIDTRKWPWGNEEPDCTRVNHNEINRRDGNCPAAPQKIGIHWVGQHPRGASPYGVHDMAGNAFEWVQDKYDVYYYLYSPMDNPQGPPTSRVTKDRGTPWQPLSQDQLGFPVFSIRGGSHRDNAFYMRVAHRHWGHHGDTPNTDEPYFRSPRVGFRCARSVP